MFIIPKLIIESLGVLSIQTNSLYKNCLSDTFVYFEDENMGNHTFEEFVFSCINKFFNLTPVGNFGSFFLNVVLISLLIPFQLRERDRNYKN